MNTIPHVSEKYYCQTCNDFKKGEDVRKNWMCPDCGEYVQIHIITEKLDNSCFRIPVTELKVGDMALMDRREEFREVFGIHECYKNKKQLRISLKEYGTITQPKTSTIMKLHGSWNP